jgi:2-keto-3-deoxy-L-rhamnonate aldolase RhmA
MPLGIFGLTAASVTPYIQKGFTLITAGIDTTLLGQAARDLLTKLKQNSS